MVRGNETKTPLPEEILSKKGTLNCHSHPYIGDVRPSPEDLDVALKMQWQEDFHIISPDNKEGIYTAQGIVRIKDINRGMTSEAGLELYKKLFEKG